MKQNAEIIRLLDFMESEDGWGHDEGKTVGDRLRAYIDTKAEIMVFRISLTGVRRTDASFPRESVLSIAQEHQKSKGFCLTDVANKDLLDNWEAAAVRKDQPLVVWNTKGWCLIGPKLTDSLKTLFEFVIAREAATTSEVATGLAISVPNASNQLKKIWEAGYVLRRERSAVTGGIEFEYFVPR